MGKNQEQNFSQVCQLIEKKYGAGSIMVMSGKTDTKVKTISSSVFSLDLALGTGGFPRGRIVEIFGPESSGKTTLALTTIAQAQIHGGKAVFIDAEHALDFYHAQVLGVDIENLWVSQPDSGEDALDIAQMLIGSGAIDVLVIDSVAALIPRQELQGEMGQAHMGLQARLISKAMRKHVALLQKTNTCAIFVNQIREKINGYGNPYTTPGGKALKYYSSVRIDIRKIKHSQQEIRVKARVVKNKLAPPFQEAEFDIVYGKGINRVKNLLEIAIDKGIVKKQNNKNILFAKKTLGKNIEEAIEYLTKKPDICSSLVDTVATQLS